jgi:hypothetical protein
MKLVLATDEFKEELKVMMESAMSILCLGSWYQECLATDAPEAKEICTELSINLFKNLQKIQEGCEIIPLKDGRTSLKFSEDIHPVFDKLINHLHFSKFLSSNNDPHEFLKSVKESLEENT